MQEYWSENFHRISGSREKSIANIITRIIYTISMLISVN